MRNQFGSEMRYQTTVATRPATLPVFRDAVKLHCRLPLDLTAEDSLIDHQIREATDAVEKDSNRALVCQQRIQYMDRFPLISANDTFRDPGITTNNIEVHGSPIISIDSVTYTDYSGTTQTWPSTAYQVNLADEPGQIRYVWGGLWPICRIQERSVAISYHCGYATPYIVSGTSQITLYGRAPVAGEVVRISTSSGQINSQPNGLQYGTDYYVVNVSGQTCGLSLTANGSAVSITSQGFGSQFLGEINPRAIQAIYLRVAANYADREGQEHASLMEAYWSQINGLRYEGW